MSRRGSAASRCSHRGSNNSLCEGPRRAERTGMHQSQSVPRGCGSGGFIRDFGRDGPIEPTGRLGGRHQSCQWAERLTAVMALRAGCCHGDPSTLALAQANSVLWTSCLAHGFEHPFCFCFFLWLLGFRHGTVDQQRGGGLTWSNSREPSDKLR